MERPVAFAPVSRLLKRRASALMGTRTFGDDPAVAGRMVAAMVRGIQARGVAATLKHFPGHGSVAGDSHHGLPVAGRRPDPAGARARAVPGRHPGRCASRHARPPGGAGGDRWPRCGRDLRLRKSPPYPPPRRTGSVGVAPRDASTWAPWATPTCVTEIVFSDDPCARAWTSCSLSIRSPSRSSPLDRLVEAAEGGRLDLACARRPGGSALRRWLGRAGPAGHSRSSGGRPRALAREIAEQAVTLVRDQAGLVPLRPPSAGAWQIVVIAPRPVDLTPADTSSYVALGLADAVRGSPADRLRRVRPRVEYTDPDSLAIAALRQGARTALP